MVLLGEPKSVRVSASFPFRETVKSVTQEGEQDEFELATSFGEGQLTYTSGDETRTEKIKLPDLTLRLTPYGKVLAAKGWQAPPKSRAPQIEGLIRQLAGPLGQPGFPKEPVAPRDTWTNEVPGPGGSKAQLRNVFEAFQQMHGLDCARIRSSLNVPFEQNLPPDPIGTRVELRGFEKVEILTWMAYEAGRVMSQQIDLKLNVESKTYLQGVQKPQEGKTEISARLTVEPEKRGG
jgi:hypothetical protein